MTTLLTYEQALSRHFIEVPPHLEAQAQIPVLSGFQRQGDVYIDVWEGDIPSIEDFTPITSHGLKVVEGDSDRNSHIIDVVDGEAFWLPGTVLSSVADYGLLLIRDHEGSDVKATGFLTHTGEHGANAFPAGAYRVWGQVSYEAELRRAAD